MNKDLIERNALKEHIGSYAGMFTDELGFAVSMEAVLRGIDFVPAADAVEVVRCRECKWWDDFLCTNINGAFCVVENGDWFCASGERKEDG